jgi:hypothetical protein
MGAKRGNFTEAIIEAIDAWIEKDEEKKVRENEETIFTRRNRVY